YSRSGKSVLSQRIAYLWGNGMWNHQFQYLLHIPLRKTINVFHHINGNGDDQKKDECNGGLLDFWKLLHLLPPQIVLIHEMMLFMHCLDACKADTDSSFLLSQIRTCHKLLVHSFKPWIMSWIHFDKDKDCVYKKNV
ncbi:hypothetical protein RFI_36087, partial [Reticulomyxa filosa]